MPTCRKCIHWNDCVAEYDEITSYYGTDCACDNVDELCKFFKDKKYYIESPVELNQTVWFIRDKYTKEAEETKVDKIVLKKNGLHIKLACNATYETSSKSIGKTVFLNKEDAEKVLKERG